MAQTFGVIGWKLSRWGSRTLHKEGRESYEEERGEGRGGELQPTKVKLVLSQISTRFSHFKSSRPHAGKVWWAGRVEYEGR